MISYGQWSVRRATCEWTGLNGNLQSSIPVADRRRFSNNGTLVRGVVSSLPNPRGRRFVRLGGRLIVGRGRFLAIGRSPNAIYFGFL